MRIVVCMKLVADPEASIEAYSLSPDGLRVLPKAGVKSVVSTFDENALEAALKLRDQHGGTVIALGLEPRPDAQAALKRALHMGADEAVLVADPNLAAGGPVAVAAVLAAAIRKIGSVDLVLCGRQGAEWDHGVVGIGIAHALGWPCATIVRRLAAVSGGLEVDRLADDGLETLSVPLPAVITASGELNTPRLTNAAAIMAAMRKKIQVLSPGDLGPGAASLTRAEPLELLRLEAPERNRECQLVAGETEEDAAVLLANQLRAAQIL